MPADRPDFTPLDAREYAERVTTPAKSAAYYERYHRPLIDEALAKAGRDAQVWLFNLACGHGFELQHLPEDSRVCVLGMDIAAETLRTSTRQNIPSALRDRSLLIAADARRSPVAPESMDVGMMVNALIYAQREMMAAMCAALKPGAACASNFPVYGRPENAAFFEYHLSKGAKLRARGEDDLVIGASVIEMQGVDYRSHEDPLCRPLNVQSYFRSVDDAEALICDTGFRVRSHEVFTFRPPVCDRVDTDVFIFEKSVF